MSGMGVRVGSGLASLRSGEDSDWRSMCVAG